MTENLTCCHLFLIYRSNKHSYDQGVIQEESFENGNKRRLVSLKICFMSWLYEFVGVVFTILTPLIQEYGGFNVYFVDAILMFVVLPAQYLMNDEDIKTVITQDGWIQGLKKMLGWHNKVSPQGPIVAAQARNE